MNRDLGLFAEALEAEELVIDQCFERSRVHGLNAALVVIDDPREYWEKCRLGLAGRSPSCYDEVTVAVEQFVDGIHLYLPKLGPAHPVERLLDRCVETRERRRISGWRD